MKQYLEHDIIFSNSSNPSGCCSILQRAAGHLITIYFFCVLKYTGRARSKAGLVLSLFRPTLRSVAAVILCTLRDTSTGGVCEHKWGRRTSSPYINIYLYIYSSRRVWVDRKRERVS